MTTPKKDFLGNELSVGDIVVMIRPQYRELVKATITRFTDHYVFVKYRWSSTMMAVVKQTPDQLIKINTVPTQAQINNALVAQLDRAGPS